MPAVHCSVGRIVSGMSGGILGMIDGFKTTLCIPRVYDASLVNNTVFSPVQTIPESMPDFAATRRPLLVVGLKVKSPVCELPRVNLNPSKPLSQNAIVIPGTRSPSNRLTCQSTTPGCTPQLHQRRTHHPHALLAKPSILRRCVCPRPSKSVHPRPAPDISQARCAHVVSPIQTQYSDPMCSQQL